MDMNIIGAGSNSNVELQIDPSHFAARTSPRPWEHQPGSGVNGGHYAVGGMTGLMAAGIASLAEILQIRWADPSKLLLLKKLIVQFSTATGFAATTLGAPIELIIGHGSSANGSGGAAVSPNSISNRMRSSMASSGFVSAGGIRIATTAALVAATGQTLEPASIAACMGADNRTLVSTPQIPLWDMEANGDHPLILGNGDTAVLRTVSPAATGTWYMSFLMSWMEAVSF